MKKTSLFFIAVILFSTFFHGTGPIQFASAQSANTNLAYQLVYVTHNRACGNYDYQMTNEYNRITKLYLQEYGVSHYGFSPDCVSQLNLDSYTPPDYVDLFIIVYSKNLGREVLHENNIGGLFHWIDASNAGHLTIEVCDCPAHVFGDPDWLLSHELAHFVLYHLGYDRSIFIDWVHQIQDTKNTYCPDGDFTVYECSNIYTILDAEEYDYKAMIPYPGAYNRYPPQEKYNIGNTKDVEALENVVEMAKEFEGEIENTPPSPPPLPPEPTLMTRSVKVQDSTQSILYTAEKTLIKKATINDFNNSLILEIGSSRTSSITVTIPRTVIDAKIGSDDDSFFVLVNGLEVDFEETVDSKERELTIPIFSDTERIEIFGTVIGSVEETTFEDDGDSVPDSQDACPTQPETYNGYQDNDGCPDEKPETTKPELSGGGCLIATAAYGTELAPQVQILREIRDNVLFGTNSGTVFLMGFNQFYYTFSPTIADWERQNPAFRELVKTAITPMLSTLSILNYVDIDSESEMLGYGIGIILLNIGMYFVVPVIILVKLKNFRRYFRR